MPKRALITDPQQAVDAYATRLCELVDSCAEHQRHDPEVFLWNARRAVEAMCHLLLTVRWQQPSRRQGGKEGALDTMIAELRKEGYFDQAQEHRFDNLREQTNLGVHIRQPERERYPAAVEDVSALLAHAVTWLLEASPAASVVGPVPRDRLLAAAREIKLGGRNAPPMAKAARELEIAHRNLEVAHRELEQRLATLEGGGIAPPHPPRAEPPPAAQPARASLGLMVLVGLTGAIAGAVGVSGLLWGLSRPPSVVEAAPPPAEPTPAAVAAVAARPVAEAKQTCPEGTVWVDGATVRLGQPEPERERWPPASPSTIAPIEVAAFCVEPAPVSRAAFEAWPEATTLGATGERCSPPAKEDSAVCVTRDAAAAYCAWRWPDGRLPSIAEWERLKRGEAGVTLGGVRRQWAQDDYPPAVLNRAARVCNPPSCPGGMFWQPLEKAPASPDGALLLGWHNQESNKRWGNLGFRCVVAPG